ncbi:MAG: GNAT family N-acetyltransferase [Candidatus Thorarchaeota archaeon]
MKANLFNVKPYNDSIGLSSIVDLYNQMNKYLNPETTLQVTEEMARIYLGQETVFSRDYLVFEDKQGKIIAFTGLSLLPMVKDAYVVVYGVQPEYIDSKLPGELIDATLDLKNNLNISKCLFETVGELSAPFDEKLESLGFSPVNYTWAMRLDNFDLFSNPGIPEGVNIKILKEMDDFAGTVNILNEAFADSFMFKPITKVRWKKMTSVVKKNHIIEHCVAYEDDKYVGICDIYLNPEEDQSGLIANFAVLPSHQHRKIGSALLATSIEMLRKKGCKTIKLGVDTKNEKALGLYKKFGFYVKPNLTHRAYQIID